MFNPVPANPDPSEKKEDEQTHTESAEVGEIPDDAYVYALDRLLKGDSQREVRKSLLEAGYTLDQCQEILDYARSYGQESGAIVEAARNRSAQQMWGLGLFTFGVLISCASYASAAPGGSYFVTTGLIVSGLFMFLRGGFGSNRN